MKNFVVSLDTSGVNINKHPDLDKIHKWSELNLIKIELADAFDSEVKMGCGSTNELPKSKKNSAKKRLNKAEKYGRNPGGIILGHPNYSVLGVNHLGTEPREELIKEIVFGKNYCKSNYDDVRHLAIHDSRNNDFFITLDRNHILKKRKELAKEKIFVLTPKEFVSFFENFFN